ncbi:MAG: hypothetical protein ACIAQ0_01305 [Phycisphaerales bacterium JB058]|jgi:hypothetical protein
MSNQHTNGKSRFQTTLLAAIAGLLALDVGARFVGDSAATPVDAAQAVPVSYQPEDTANQFANPILQRKQMVDQLKSIDRRLSAIETQLKGKLRVEVMNFPQPKAEGKD